MRRLTAGICGLIAMGSVLFGGGQPALAATGRVLVFQHELMPLTTYHNPSGCVRLPALSHAMVNKTERTVRVFAGPLCAGAFRVVSPSFGSHVPAGGSFSV